MSQITKYHAKKKNLTVALEGEEPKEYEGDKKDIEALSVHIETALRSKTTPIATKAHSPASVVAAAAAASATSGVGSKAPTPSHSVQHSPVHSSTFPPFSSVSNANAGGVAKLAIAIYEWTPKEDGELLIHENDMLIVLDDSDPDWWMVKHLKKSGEGLVPKTYIEV